MTNAALTTALPPTIRHCRDLALRTALVLATTVLLMADDWVQQWFTPANQADFELNYFVALLAFNLGLWLCGSRVFVSLVLLLLGGMQLVQLGHISYAGRPLDPIALASLFAEFHDVEQVAHADFADHFHVLIAVAIPYLAAWCLFMAHMRRDVRRWQRALGVMLVAAGLLSKPYRASYRDLNAFLPGPTRSGLHNSLNTFSFYLVHNVLHGGVQKIPTVDVPAPVVTPFPSDARHVWLFVADSLRAGHLGVLDYGRDTTPRLARRMEQGLVARHGVAAAVSTAASMPLILNAVREPGQLSQIRGNATNLFRLAKEAGFTTYWISSQESKLLNDVGSRYVDVSVTREDEPERFLREGDDAVLSLMREQAWPDKTFVVVLLRSVHAPYEANYAHARQHFARWPDGRELPRAERMRNAYDNAVLYLDTLLDRMMGEFDRLSGPRHLVVTGDHGQLLGSNGLWGHNVLEPEVADVPVLAWSRDAGAAAPAWPSGERWVSHYEMGRWLARQLGSDIRSLAAIEGVHYLQGKNLYGANTFREVHEGVGLEFSEVLPVGHGLPVRPYDPARPVAAR
ncbi:Putative phosphoethanolamine transferase YhbX [Pigmentiphaga humi]|uniref:Phosphoethanolamine transferase YhbX n=1 Tax=Pigmentiphaga humi TaxID=2478468 RepID=A0A3P4B387_9BURK|nr:sulfatase-like hydrolase/transferase [Pigmentiphaga humi]VCU70743.1 Putative phosphoethanolamine transferase YhbX [Pigmentiphaga humi]